MTIDAEIWRAASRLIDLHGENAPRYALAAVELLIERGDLGRARQWRCVSDAATILLRKCPAFHDPVH